MARRLENIADAKQSSTVVGLADSALSGEEMDRFLVVDAAVRLRGARILLHVLFLLLGDLLSL